MNKSDIEKFLNAKHQLQRERQIVLVLSITLVAYLLLRVFGVQFEYMDHIALGIFIGGLAIYSGNWRTTTYSELVEIIEKQINQDASALEYVARNDT